MEEYRGNSNRSKREKEETEKKLEKITTGKVKTKKKSGMSKFANAIVSEDVSNVGSYIFMDVLIPAMKKALSDIVTNGTDMLLYGETGRSDRKSRADRVAYGSCYNRDRDRRERVSRSRATYEYDDIVLDTRGEAERVIDKLEDSLDEYGTVSIGDLYDLVGITGSYTDYKYGWTDLRSARAERVRDGYLIKLPRALPLD